MKLTQHVQTENFMIYWDAKRTFIFLQVKQTTIMRRYKFWDKSLYPLSLICHQFWYLFTCKNEGSSWDFQHWESCMLTEQGGKKENIFHSFLSKFVLTWWCVLYVNTHPHISTEGSRRNDVVELSKAETPKVCILEVTLACYCLEMKHPLLSPQLGVLF